MSKPSTQEVQAAIASYLAESTNRTVPFSTIAQRLGVSVSTVRRAASAHGIVRRPRLGKTVLESIDRVREEGAR